NRAVFQHFEAWPMRRGSPRPAAMAPARREGGAEVLQPTVERHGSFSLSRLVCDTRTAPSPPARRPSPGAGPGRGGTRVAAVTPRASDFFRTKAAFHGLRLLPLPLQFRDELLEVFPLAQGIEVGVFLHVRHVLVALAHRLVEELHRRVAVEAHGLVALLVCR